MTKPTVISESPISMIELKAELERIKKRDEELNFRANKTDEYLSQFLTLSPKKGKELKEKILGMEISRLKEEHITKIIDVMPQTVEELKVLLQGYVITISQENMKKIVEAIKEFK